MNLNDDAKEPKNCLIYWRNLIENTEGNGTTLMTRTLAENMVNVLNAYYAHLIHHWVVEVKGIQSDGRNHNTQD